MKTRPINTRPPSGPDSPTDRKLLKRLIGCSISELLSELTQLSVTPTLVAKELVFRGSRDRLTPEHRLALQCREPQIRAHLRGQRLLTGEGDSP